MTIRTWAILSIALGTAGSFAKTQQTIPKAQGTTLAGAAVGLPDAVKGKVGVLVVGFSKSSQGQAAAWGRRLSGDFGHSDEVVYFEVPMLAGAPRILRGMIVKSMESSIPEAERSHFLPLTENEAGWRAVAHYSKPDDAYVLLVDGTGAIRWQTEGDATDEAYNALKKNLGTLTAPGGGM